MSQSSAGANIPDPFEAKDLGGIFYPVDYLVAAFANSEDARHARQGLAEKGFEESACLVRSGEEMSVFLEKIFLKTAAF